MEQPEEENGEKKYQVCSEHRSSHGWDERVEESVELKVCICQENQFLNGRRGGWFIIQG